MARPRERECISKFLEDQNKIRDLITKSDADELWDAVQAKDVPADILDYVAERTREGFTPGQIRKQMGIHGELNPKWVKIMSAFRGGLRVDGSAVFFRFMSRAEKLTKKLEQLIDNVVIDKRDGESVKNVIGKHGKEIAMLSDAICKLQSSAIKAGAEMGIYSDEDKGGGGKVSILVQNNIPTPSDAEIKAHRDSKEVEAEVVEVGGKKD